MAGTGGTGGIGGIGGKSGLSSESGFPASAAVPRRTTPPSRTDYVTRGSPQYVIAPPDAMAAESACRGVVKILPP